MAKRKKHPDEELPFVALMDTMTNVVGVLLIVLVMVGISISSSVKKILSDLPPITVEEFEKLAQQLKEQPKDTQTPEDVLKKTDEAIAQIKKLTEELKSIDLTDEQQKVKFIDLEDIRKKIERAKYDRDKEKTALDKLFAEVDRLKKLLDDTPVFQPPPPKFVRIPNPRPVPQGAVRENFLIAGGRVIYLNDRAFLEVVQREMLKSRDALLSDNHPKITSSTPATSIKYSKDKILAWVERARIGDRTLQVKLVPVATSPAFNLNLIPIQGAGESDQDLRNPASFFQRAMRKFKSEPGKIVWFYVFKDSVETYLTAREVADSIGVPVGWQIYGQSFYAARLPGVVYEPFTPPQPDMKIQAVEIAAPKEQLD